VRFSYTFGIGWRAPSTRMADIIAEVAARHGVTIEALKGPDRFRNIARVRQEAMWLMWRTGRYSRYQIGQFLGGRDHSTIRHGVLAHERRLAKLPTVKRDNHNSKYRQKALERRLKWASEVAA
jgi:chromosomal replication initiation ATPase DnaA